MPMCVTEREREREVEREGNLQNVSEDSFGSIAVTASGFSCYFFSL